MKTIALVLAFGMVVAGPALAGDPVLSAGGGGNHPPDREAADVCCWTEGPNFEGRILSSERIPVIGFESEVANDFLPSGTCVGTAFWWGGYYNYTPGDPLVTNFTLRYYEDVGCVPGAVLCEYVIPSNAYETFVYNQAGFPIYRYNWDAGFRIAADTLYWFSVQAGGHAYPPQWGRLEAAVGVQLCDTVVRCAYLGYPDWVPATDVVGAPFDCSQEFLCVDECIQTPTSVDSPDPSHEAMVPSAWGTIKGLFR